MTFQAKNIPHHLGIIIDGNRRWAQERGLPKFIGHKKGLEKVRQIVRWSKKRGIGILTVFIFSTENWQREKKEVDNLMKLAELAVTKNLKEFQREGIRVKIIGQKERLPKTLQKAIKKAEESTKNNQAMLLNLALSYGGRTEIVSAMRNIVEKKIAPEAITEKTIAENLWTSDLDLLIRTGKEQRLSNFLIWQAAYAELYFSPKYWPDFTEEDLDAALEDFAARHRRRGK